MGISKEKIQKVRAILKTNYLKSGALFSACYFGNAFTNEKIFIGEGNGRKGKYKGKQVLSPQTVEYLLTAKIADGVGIWAFGR